MNLNAQGLRRRRLLSLEICMQQIRQYHRKREQGSPDGPSHKMPAQNGGDHAPRHEDSQHLQMTGQALDMLDIPGANSLAAGDPRLAQVIGAEGGGHGNSLGDAEGVVLHGAHEIDDHLGDLIGRTLRQQAQNHHQNHLHQDQNRLPADGHRPSGRGHGSLGEQGAQEIGTHGNKEIQNSLFLI